ncbi:hypothetical protein H4582DRAFT_1985826 [Lactarius indigo]|nr:hypothetical protein H4582DRAFT_1985826 [Lactarius indigo]
MSCVAACHKISQLPLHALLVCDLGIAQFVAMQVGDDASIPAASKGLYVTCCWKCAYYAVCGLKIVVPSSVRL